MSDAARTVARVQETVALLLRTANNAQQGAVADDLSKIGRAAATLQAMLAALPSRAAEANGPETLRTLRHDIRTPVGQILGYCELLQEEADDTDDSRWVAPLKNLRAEADAMREAVDAVSRTYTGAVSGDTDVHRAVSVVPIGGGVEGASEAAEVAPSTILVVDDNADNRQLLARRLERDGHRVLTAEHGAQALEIAEQRSVDAVLLDIMMPVMDGYETLARFKADRELRHIPIIMLTSLDEQASLTACIEAGAEDHLPKPLDPVLLRARLSGCLEKKRGRDLERRYLERIVAEKKRADDLIHGVIPIGVALSGEKNEARILERTLAEARRFCGADGGLLLLREGKHLFVVQMQCESTGQSLSPSATRPPTPSGGMPARLSLSDPAKARRPEVIAALHGQTITIDRDNPGAYDLAGITMFDQTHRYQTRSSVYVPLRATESSEPGGVLQLWNATRPTDGEIIAFDRGIVEILQSLSSLAAAALDAYRRERELRMRIRRLEIRIDEQGRREEVSQITDTDYFKSLRDQARTLRKGHSSG